MVLSKLVTIKKTIKETKKSRHQYERKYVSECFYLVLNLYFFNKELFLNGFLNILFKILSHKVF
jgi:hypothetical protein